MVINFLFIVFNGRPLMNNSYIKFHHFFYLYLMGKSPSNKQLVHQIPSLISAFTCVPLKILVSTQLLVWFIAQLRIHVNKE